MTLQEFQDLVHTLYQGDTSTPSSSAADWGTRTKLAEAAIRVWDSEEGVLWNELWKLNTDSQTQTTNGTDVTFNCYSDFRMPGGFVRLKRGSENDFYEVKKSEDIELYRGQNVKICFFSGNKSGGFKLNFLTAPATGWTVEYPYYKDPTIPSVAADKFEMADPMFAVEYTLSKLHELDGEGDRAGLALSKAQAVLRTMKVRNIITPWHQSNAPKDMSMDLGQGGGFGQ